MRDLYEKELKDLKDKFDKMKELTDNILNESLDFNLKDVANIKIKLKQIKGLEKELFQNCKLLIITQQPIANDLEFITKIMKEAAKLKAIAKSSFNCAKIINKTPKSYFFNMLIDMANMLLTMLKAHENKNFEEVNRLESAINSQFKQIKKELMLLADKENVSYLFELLLLSKYFEKIADYIK
ncbi:MULTISPECIES: PhoU domain-containing protein [unclassified Campylobacter]|uniref:PhoU domain-containing protein n=1 Tax=unclassified Campylobacter TaxID=2593542 RepID=UPI001237CE60|nr:MULTISPECIES: PhoU domain-containing protein [unclassified Campylobacter]KAA6225101.1 hypothetical protein FMM55_07360 [Campylobacter sp. LR196d]KAA6226115.1 hypothetical protein FMM54_04740 [Campylobacter sp. LR185c]KAA6228062.1 hypothetical protein FMM57_03430 [Campylobacter sp. LR286c]KAA6231315.1 hypothetical protein FMM56_03880 [Campylobacter sp. LR264d]KAA6231527.1 hypothetical protein FMM58_02680 [Campylobacter sp. LR291e]